MSIEEQLRKDQRKYNPYFLKVYNDALEKMIKKRKQYGDGWLKCEVDQLEHSLHSHSEKPYWNLKHIPFEKPYKYSYDDLLDIINYCLFIGVRLKEERLK